MKKFIILVLVLVLTSCIPYKIAPKFKNQDYKVMQAKKFQRKLPRETSFIFKDPKDADEFYNYINKKYNLDNIEVGINTPFKLKGETLYLTYYEAERTDEIVNLPFVLVDAKRDSNGNSRLFENNYTTRTGHWYIIITIYDKNLKNCLRDHHPLKDHTLKYLEDLKKEYLTTHNYEELLFTKKS
ncbi:hypothetical protein DFQ11_102394 [Winogradskyella epiphytica]|uniref:Lipoprotein n=1 Tax=Winogradskyella epiphytica TaxID=262005 RepID=A0A2V4YEA5_9FLAO|nr:hypothetical protein [Winogradskyella epiphytica]PYE81817.1 hypothetical protein DFQ11_102394 [Winogradskyella epiphytica]GGW62414.1 hypothetical protein GCM10008085_12750 [Winogradskyella epiphytica]